MSDYPYNCDAKIAKCDFGKMYYSVVYVPKEIVSQLDFAKSKRLRIDGEIEGIRIEAALMPTTEKEHPRDQMPSLSARSRVDYKS